MKKQILSFLFIAAVVFVFYACSAPGGGLGGSTGTISINFGAVSTRATANRAAASRAVAITPGRLADGVLDELTHKVTLTKGATVVERVFNKGETSATIQIEPGDWNIMVEALCYDNLVASGNGRVQVMAGQSSPASVQMQARQDIEFYAVSSAADWADVFDGLAPPSGNNIVVLITKDISTSNIAMIDTNITICGDKTITYTGTGKFMEVSGSAIIYDTKLKGTGSSPDPFALVYYSLTMKGSSSISGNTNTSNTSLGGGVNIDGGSFIMEDNASVYGNTAQYGGGVAVVNNGAFTMKGSSKVYGNTATGGAGGVYVVSDSTYTNSTFTIQDNVSIYGNVAGNTGGGVYLDDGKFTMKGGTITGNKADTNGGGVYVGGLNDNATFYISNGIVYGSDAGSNSNLCNNNSGSPGAALRLSASIGPTAAQYGTFNGSTWISNGDLVTSENTIRVVNGQKQ